MKKKGIALLSFLALWAIEVIRAEGNIEIRILAGLGSAMVMAAVGIVVGGLVLFNIFLFFYNIFKPENKLSFDGNDKLITGLWFMIIVEIFRFI